MALIDQSSINHEFILESLKTYSEYVKEFEYKITLNEKENKRMVIATNYHNSHPNLEQVFFNIYYGEEGYFSIIINMVLLGKEWKMQKRNIRL